KIAIGTWGPSGDPSVYGFMDVEAGPALEYIERLRKETGLRVTLSHFTGKAVAETLRRHPDINCVLRLGRLYPRKSVDVFFQVAGDERGEDLSGMVVFHADQKSIPSITREMEERVQSIKTKKDKSFTKMKGMIAWMPGFLVKYIISFAGFV